MNYLIRPDENINFYVQLRDSFPVFCGTRDDFTLDYPAHISFTEWFRVDTYGTSSYKGKLGYHVPGIILRTPPRPVDLSLSNRFLPREHITPFSREFTEAMRQGAPDFELIFRRHTLELFDSNL